MKKTVTNQKIAAAKMAYKFSDIINFSDPFFADSRTVLEALRDTRDQNLFGQQTKIFDCEGAKNYADVLFGAIKGGAMTSMFLKDNGLLDVSRLVGNVNDMNVPAVFYVATDDKNLCTYDIPKGAGLVFPSNAQEAADLSVLAHLAVGKSYKPFVVCLNDRAAAFADEKVELPENEDINKLFDVVAYCGTRARALNRGISCDIEVPVLLEAELPEIVDHYLAKIAEEWGRSYKLIEYFGAPKAETVFVSAGTATEVLEKAVDDANADGGKFGVIAVKALAPFNAKAFAKAFPKTCKKAVLVGHMAGTSAKDPVFAMMKKAAPVVKWVPDDYMLGTNDFTAEYAAKAMKAVDEKAPTSKKNDKKYFAQAMDSKYYADLEKLFSLGKKRWVVANSAGLNNVKFGLGMTAAFEQRRDWILNEVLFLADNTIFPSVSDRGYEYLEVKDDTKKSLPALKALLADKVGADTHCSTCTNIRQELEFLDKRYFWTFGGDSRVGAIDWDALSKALSSKENMNVFCIQDKAIYKKAAEHTGAKDLFFRIKNIDGVFAKTITLDMEPEKIEATLHQAETHYGPSIVVLFA